MTDFSIRSDNVDVEQIMRQIRARIREKRGVDYTEEEIRELANVKLEKFLDPRGVRSDLLEQFRRKREASLPPNFKFEDTTLFETHRGLLAFLRRLLRPVLKLFFNPNPLIDALHIQSKLNAQQAALEPLYYEVIHNLVLETTRLGIDVKNLKMRVESMSSRLDFDERRARALEGVVQYRPGAVAPLQPPSAGGNSREARGPESPDQSERRNRRRRRRGRRRPDDRAGAESGRGAQGSRGGEGRGSWGTDGTAPKNEQPGDRGLTPEGGQSGDRGLTPAEETPTRAPESGYSSDRGLTPAGEVPRNDSESGYSSDGGLTPVHRDPDGEPSDS